MPNDLDPAAVSPDTVGVESVAGTVPAPARTGSGADDVPRRDRTASVADDTTAGGPTGHAVDGSAVNDPTESAQDDLTGRVRAVEELPLADRAEGFSALHDELRTRLETGGAGA